MNNIITIYMTRTGHVGGVGISLRTGDLIVCQVEDEKQRIASETFANFALYSTKTWLM